MPSVADSTVAQLHGVLQVAFGWEDEHLNRFEIRGRGHSWIHDLRLEATLPESPDALPPSVAIQTRAGSRT